MGAVGRTLQERFWPKVDMGGGPDGCWLWTAATRPSGYGVIGIRLALLTYRVVPAHRISWEIANGPIPSGLCVLHRCDIRPCVNPSHLFLGTKADNTHDMMQKGRAVSRIGEANARKTHCARGHEFTEENTARPYPGKRACRKCRRENHRRYRESRRQSTNQTARTV